MANANTVKKALNERWFAQSESPAKDDEYSFSPGALIEQALELFGKKPQQKGRIVSENWDPEARKRDSERQLDKELPERLAPFVEPEALDSAVKSARPVIEAFAGRFRDIEDRTRVRANKAKDGSKGTGR